MRQRRALEKALQIVDMRLCGRPEQRGRMWHRALSQRARTRDRESMSREPRPQNIGAVPARLC